MSPSLRLNKLTRKYVLKKAMEGILPKEVIWRRKAGFGAPIHAWITGPLKEMVTDLLSPDTIKRRGYFNSAYVENQLSLEFSNREYLSNHIWALLTLELWQQTFLDSSISNLGS